MIIALSLKGNFLIYSTASEWHCTIHIAVSSHLLWQIDSEWWSWCTFLECIFTSFVIRTQSVKLPIFLSILQFLFDQQQVSNFITYFPESESESSIEFSEGQDFNDSYPQQQVSDTVANIWNQSLHILVPNREWAILYFWEEGSLHPLLWSTVTVGEWLCTFFCNFTYIHGFLPSLTVCEWLLWKAISSSSHFFPLWPIACEQHCKLFWKAVWSCLQS